MALRHIPHVREPVLPIGDHLDHLLRKSAAGHRHLCPRQVLGVRMGLWALDLLDLTGPELEKKGLFTIVETDGCFVSGIAAATGTSSSRRTMRLVDYGKIAATFINRKTEHAVRIRPNIDARQRAWDFCPEDVTRRYYAMLHGYRDMPAEILFEQQDVALNFSLKEWISMPGLRTNCSVCGEEIVNRRELLINGLPICQPCGGDSYFATPTKTDPGDYHG